MESRVNLLNTIILLAVLAVVVVVGILLVMSVRQLVNPLERAEEALSKQIAAITHPTPTVIPDPVTIIRQVRALSRLETASYTIEKIITAESGQGPFSFLFGDRLILVAHGQVIAGVDLAKIQEGDIAVSEDSIAFITLPPAEVFVTVLDNRQSYVYDRDTGMIGLNPSLETAARQAAEDELLKAAIEGGLLETAQQNAEVYLRHLIVALGFHDARFSIAPTPEPIPAD
ncbi:MAG: DUF4230 domain-containing protein [Chloroflexi bacterium]|nr:DUF4230 domain-containing protein [Chloroflexota bacterium]